MNELLKETREMLGISQQAMYYYLQVSRSLYTMVELGHRNLPTKASLKAMQFMNAMDLPPLPMSADFEKRNREQETSLRKKMQKTARYCQLRQAVLERKLEKMIDGYNQVVKLLQTVAQIEAAAPPQGHSEYDQLNFSALKGEALIKLDKCGILEQGLLQHRISLLKAEAELALQNLS